MGFGNIPPISFTSDILTEDEKNYVTTLVETLGWSVLNKTKATSFIDIGKNQKPIYVLQKWQGYYSIHQLGTQLYKSSGFVEIATRLKHLLDSDNKGSGGTQDPIPNEPPGGAPSGEAPQPPTNPNFQVIAKELVNDVAHVMNMTPEAVWEKKDSWGAHLIPVIKAIRAFYKSMELESGIGAAKEAAVHWQDFLDYILDNGLPSLKEGHSEEFKNLVVGYSYKKAKQKPSNKLNELVSEIATQTGLSQHYILTTHIGGIGSSIKITAVKEFRYFYSKNGLGDSLAWAKTAIEKWPSFVAYATKYGLPKMETKEFNDALKYNDTPSVPDSLKLSPASLSEDEKEWISTFFANKYPHLEIDDSVGGMIYVTQPDTINEIKSGQKALFVIYKNSPNSYVFKHAGGDELLFSDFLSLSNYISGDMKKLVPAAPQTVKTTTNIQDDNFISLLSYTNAVGGINVEGTAIHVNLDHLGYIWNKECKAYINTSLYQFVRILDVEGTKKYDIYWVDTAGNQNGVATFKLDELYSMIGKEGSLAKSTKPVPTNKFNPIPEQEKILQQLGFVKNFKATSSDDPIIYTKPSDDATDAYYTIDIDPYTGEVEYAEVDEGGTSEGANYPTLGHALTFLKNKFAASLHTASKINTHLEYITKELSKIGFHFKDTDESIYSYVSTDGNEAVDYNYNTSKVSYSVKKSPTEFDIIQSFYNISDFVDYYVTNQGKKSSLGFQHIFEKLGFKKDQTSGSKTKWKKAADHDDLLSYSILTDDESPKDIMFKVVDNNNVTISTKVFSNIDDLMKLLKFKFDFHPPSVVPYSGQDYKEAYKHLADNNPYKTIRLNIFDEATLKNIGFHFSKTIGIGKNQSGHMIYVDGYIANNGNRVFFYEDGNAIYKIDENNGGLPFPTVSAMINFLWTSTDWTDIPEKNKKEVVWQSHFKPEKKTQTGNMPYSGYDYSLKFILFDHSENTSTLLEEFDNLTMLTMGFKPIIVTSVPDYFYKKGNEKIRFCNNGNAHYWLNDTYQKKFDTVKEAMKFLWDKHTTYIEECATYKNFMTNWIS